MRTLLGPYRAFPLLLVLGGCGPEGESFEPTTSHEEELFYDSTELWLSPSISVCWSGGSANDPERGWIKSAVEAAYEPITDIDFTGWGSCTSSGAHIVIIVDEDAWPRAGIGRKTASWLPNMWLNFFKTSAHDLDNGDADSLPDFPGCYSALSMVSPAGKTYTTRRRYCLETIAVHEFAHALSVTHEQGRDDRPAWCTETDDGGFTEYGYWDPLSISNYCNPAWNGAGLLSTLDVSGLQSLYGRDGNDFVWFSIGNARDYGDDPSSAANVNQIGFEVKRRAVSGDYQPIVGDRDGDGNDDIFWYGPGSLPDNHIWGSADRIFEQTTNEVVGTYKTGAGDFDCDGFDDVLWFNGGGTSRIFWGNADRTNDSAVFIPSWNIAALTPLVGDFDGNGCADIFWYKPNTGTAIQYGMGNRYFSPTGSLVTGSGYAPVVGNFDGDCCDDVFWYSPQGSEVWWYGKNMTGHWDVVANPLQVSGVYDWLAVGDYDGDGDSDILFNNSTETDSLWLFNARNHRVNTRVSYVGTERPLVGDFDGNGKDDIYWYVKN